MKYTTIINNQQFEIEINKDGTLTVNGEKREADFLPISGSLYSIIKDNRSLELAIEDAPDSKYEILMEGRLYEGMVLDERAMMMMNRKGGLTLDSGDVNSPMPGLIVEVTVNEGDTVTQGQTVVILESMKMQNELKAPRDGVVQSVSVSQGQSVEKNALLLSIGDAE